MSGDSFCKKDDGGGSYIIYNVFQSPCLGTLFASENPPSPPFAVYVTFNPHVWGLFLQAPEYDALKEKRNAAFNPHVWGLFLQVTDKATWVYQPAPTFNPHVWGLFLQVPFLS